MRLGELDAVVDGPEGGPLAVLVHGIGLGPWLWEPWMPIFVAAGVRVVALQLPGPRENLGFSELVSAVEGALDALGAPVMLVGHSMGGLVAQVIAARRDLAALALVCPLPPGQVALSPSFEAVCAAARLLPRLIRGAPLQVSWSVYRRVGLDRMDEATARACYARTTPWPARLVVDLVARRPIVDVTAVQMPVLTCIGGRDRLVPWQKARLLGDLYEGVTWRYDDLGHMPPWEPGGERMGRDLAAWLLAPSRPQVLESEGYAPDEGVGHTLRRGRRGAEMKRRSAYGQRGSARG